MVSKSPRSGIDKMYLKRGQLSNLSSIQLAF
jgi:hypothetical protein